jgi:hypothetical protein
MKKETEVKKFESETCAVFPLAEVKELLERHGYIMEQCAGFSAVSKKEHSLSIVLSHKCRRSGISAVAWFSDAS